MADTSEIVALQQRADALQAEVAERSRTEASLIDRLAAHTRRGVANQELFRLIVESVHDYAIFMLDPTGRVATWNAGAERIKQYRADEIVGRHFSAFYPDDAVRSGLCEHELEVAAQVGRFEDEGWRLRKDGTRFWANVIISAVRDADGVLIGFSKVTRDLTERRRAEEERLEERRRVSEEQAAREVAERASRAKDEFLAMLGHELRNPMAPILTALELMKLRGDGLVTREQAVIERQVKHMMRLVDDLLDISRITRGKVELHRAMVEVRTIANKALEVASPMIEQRRQHLEVDVPDEPLVVNADEDRLIQALSNLLTNASKYTPEGGRLSLAVRPASHDHVEIEVHDDGIGIDAELLPQVFDLFVQGHQTAERAAGGLGLGLALVRSLVAMHDGSVEAHSPGRGQGSTFTIRLRLAEELTDPDGDLDVGVPIEVAPVALRILLVDDNEDARELLGEALASVGHEVRTAADPAEALELIRTFVPDVAILDIGLPVMDGYELAARLRAAIPTRVPRLIALTGYGQDQDRARSRAAGFEAHLVKPIDLARLFELVSGPDVSTRIVMPPEA